MQLFNGPSPSRSAGIGEKIVRGSYSQENVQENVRGGDWGIVLDGCSDPRKGLQVSTPRRLAFEPRGHYDWMDRLGD